MRGIVTASALNVRNGPGMEAAVIGRLTRDAVIEVLGTHGDWLETEFHGGDAFVHAGYVALSADPPSSEWFWQRDDLLHMDPAPRHALEVSGSNHYRQIARLYNAYGNLLESLAGEVGIDTGAAVAVLQTESGGRAFGRDGSLIIRFENHSFYDFWGTDNQDVYFEHFRFESGRRWRGHLFRTEPGADWLEFHGDQVREWEALDLARGFDDTAALKSISMGAPQIMGFNHEAIGFRTVQEMMQHMSQSTRHQILSLFDFFDERQVEALRSQDFRTFARCYNGTGQMNRYSELLWECYRAFENLRE